MKLIFRRVPENTVLLAEPNAFHGEILPGFARYFQALGFRVVVLMRYANWKESPFCRFAEPPEQYCLTVWGMRRYLRSHKREQYKHVLLTSARAYIKEHRYYWRYPAFLGWGSGQETNVSMIEHEFSEEAYRSFFEKSDKNPQLMTELLQKTFVLTSFEYRGHVFPELNPCYWGRVTVNKTLNSGKRIFVAIGRISDKSRNFGQLLNAIEVLPEDVPYEIHVIGSGTLDHFPEKCRKHIRLLGRLSFEKMFECIENADFFLPLLELGTQGQYLQYCTSGSRQLILGFGKIPVIQEAFARHYGFDESSAVLYHDDFCGAMKQALALNDEQYVGMVQSMQREYERVYQNSLENLRQRIA